MGPRSYTSTASASTEGNHLSGDRTERFSSYPPIVALTDVGRPTRRHETDRRGWDAAGIALRGRVRPRRRLGRRGTAGFREDVRRFDAARQGWSDRSRPAWQEAPDLYRWADRPPQASINFSPAPTGFTLKRLVSYNSKHNEWRRTVKGNRDGGSTDK